MGPQDVGRAVIRNKPGFTIPPASPVTHPCGGASTRSEVLAFLVNQYELRTGVEIGAWDGRTAARVLSLCPGLTWMVVDPWKPQPWHNGPEDWTEWDHDVHEAQCRERLAPFGQRAQIFKGFSLEAARHTADGSLDLVFLDGDHSENGVRMDVHMWRPKLRRGGWLAGHDYAWQGVRAAVDDLVGAVEVGPNDVWFRQVS